MSYIGNSPGVASQRVTTTLTATAGQTQFTTQSGYVLGYVDVYLNGAKLVNGSDFEAITGTFVTLFEAAAVGDVVELISYVPRGLSDGYTKAEADAKFLDVGGDTATGSINLGTNGLVVGTNQLVASGSKVGVGTASPTETLTVVGNIKAGYEPATGLVLGLTNSVPDNNVNAYLLWGADSVFGGVNGDLIYIPRSSATASHRFYTGTTGLASEKVRISNAGNLGIGVTSPAEKLDVDGSIRIRGAANQRSIGFNFYGVENYNFYVDGSTDSARMAIRRGTTEVAVFNASNNVGIGTSSPNARLHVSRSGPSVIRNQETSVGVNSSWNASDGSITFFGNESNHPLVFITNSTERVRIDTTGRLLVGINAGSYAIDVGDTSGGNMVRFSRSGAEFGGFISGGTPFFGSISNSPFVVMSAGVGRMHITTSGDIGVNMSTPQSKFHVATGVGSAYGIRTHGQSSAVGDYNGILISGSGTGSGVPYYSGAIRVQATAASPGYQEPVMSFWLQNSNTSDLPDMSERARFTTNGNFLIGTTASGSPGLGVANSTNISFPESTNNTSFATIFRQASSADLVLGNGVRYSSTANGFASSTGSAWARSSIGVGYGAIKFFTAAEATVAVGTDVSMTERGRFTSTGNFLIGTTSSPGNGARLVVSAEGFPATSEILADFRAGTTSPTSERYVLLSQSYTGSGFDSPMLAFRANGNGSNQSAFGTIRTAADGSMIFSNIGPTNSAISGVTEKVRITPGGIIRSGNVELGRVHTDIMAMWRAADMQGYTTQASDGGAVGYTWDNGIVRVDNSVGSHNWDIGKIRLAPGTYQLVLVYRPSPTAHDWNNYGTNSNGHAIRLQSDAEYATRQIFISAEAYAINKDLKYSITYTSSTYTVTTDTTFRIGMSTDPYSGGGYKYYVEAAYLVRLN